MDHHKPKGACHRCHRHGHLVRNCPLRPPNTPECGFCHRVGNTMENCPCSAERLQALEELRVLREAESHRQDVRQQTVQARILLGLEVMAAVAVLPNMEVESRNRVQLVEHLERLAILLAETRDRERNGFSATAIRG